MVTKLKRSGNDDILLGWTLSSTSSIGFTERGHAKEAEPIYCSSPHLLTVAPTGAGKGVCAAIPALLEYPGQVVALDVKGELYSCTSRARREMGQQVIRLDPFNVLGKDSDSLNPLDILTLPGADLETDCETLAKLLSTGREFSRDPFWHLTGNGVNAGLMMYIATCESEENRNLARLTDLLYGDDVVYGCAVLLDTKGKSMPKAAYRELAAFLQLPEKETRPSTLATAQSFLKCLTSNRILQSLSETSFDLEGFRQGMPMTIYIVIPPERLNSHAAIVSLWIGTLLKTIFSRSRSPKYKTLALLDEAASLGSFPMLETAVTLCRSFGVRVWSFWQDLQQIQSSFPNGWRTLVNNSGLQVFGINSKLMASELSQVIDLSPSRLLAMDSNSQFLQLPGQEPVVSRRVNYLRDRRYRGKFDVNRFYDSDSELAQVR